MAITESKIAVTEGSGKNLDTVQITTGAGVVEREMVSIGDPETAGNRAGVDEDGDLAVSVGKLSAAVLALLGALANPVSVDPTSGRQRVVLDATGGAQTLGTVTTVTTVTTVATVTNVSNVVAFGVASAGISAASLIADTMNNSYANQVLRCIA